MKHVLFNFTKGIEHSYCAKNVHASFQNVIFQTKWIQCKIYYVIPNFYNYNLISCMYL